MAQAENTRRSATDHLALLLGQWFFSGRSKIAPGTVGSLFALPFFWFLRSLDVLVYWSITAFVCALGVVVSNRCAVLLNDDDPSSVVIDEVAGVLIALGCVMSGPLWVMGVAWSLFRLFDITKPWLIDRAQYLPPAGLGIMADDILAGMVAGGLSWTLLFLL